jgi:hypothetical protein
VLSQFRNSKTELSTKIRNRTFDKNSESNFVVSACQHEVHYYTPTVSHNKFSMYTPQQPYYQQAPPSGQYPPPNSSYQAQQYQPYPAQPTQGYAQQYPPSTAPNQPAYAQQPPIRGTFITSFTSITHITYQVQGGTG